MDDLEKLSIWAASRRENFRTDVAWAESRNDADARGRAIGRVDAYDEVAFVAAEMAKGNDLTGIVTRPEAK